MFSTKSLFAATAALSLIATSSAAGNVAVYWGSGAGQARLRTFCDESSIDIIPIGFLSLFPQQGNGFPKQDFGNACWGDTVYYGPGNDHSKDSLYTRCPTVQEDIPYCQSIGKKIVLSLGGGTTGYQLTGAAAGTAFADFLWGAYGPKSAAWIAAGGIRPLDRGLSNTTSETIDIDGFDFDIEHTSTDNQEGYIACINRLRTLFASVPSKKYLITGAPQCPLPEANMGTMIAAAQFDILWIQFYNNGGYGCNARDWANANPNYDTNGVQMGTNLNYNAWKTKIQSGASKNAKLYLGLIGAPTGADCTKASYGDYINPTEANSLISAYKSDSQFGGVMLWDATASINNKCVCKPYYSIIKDSLNGVKPQTGTVCTSSTTSSTSTSKTSTSSTSSKPTTTTSSSSTKTSSSSTSPTSSSTSSKPTSSSSSSSVTSSKSSSTSATSTSSSSSSSSSSSISSSASVTSSSSSSSSSSTSTSVSSSSSSSSSESGSSTSGSVTSTSSSASVTSTSSSSASSGTSSTSSTTVDTTSSSSSSSTFPTFTPPWGNTTFTSKTSTSATSSDPTVLPTSTTETTPTPSGTTSNDPNGPTPPLPTGTSTTEYTTSTHYTTKTETITSCAPTITNCPIGSVVTRTIAEYTTVCPVGDKNGNGPAPTPAPIQYTTSTVYATKIYTVTACPPSVHNCPQRGSVTTEIIPAYTTVCPVAQGGSGGKGESKPTNAPVVPGAPEVTITYTTATISTTKVLTVTACAPGIKCPGTVTTVTVPYYTTVYPVPKTTSTATIIQSLLTQYVTVKYSLSTPAVSVIPIPVSTPVAPYPTPVGSCKTCDYETGTGIGTGTAYPPKGTAAPSVSIMYVEVNPVPVSEATPASTFVVKPVPVSEATPAPTFVGKEVKAGSTSISAVAVPVVSGSSTPASPSVTPIQGAASKMGSSAFAISCAMVMGVLML